MNATKRSYLPWAKEQFSKMSAQTQEDTTALLTTLREKGTNAASDHLLKLTKERSWPRWVMYAIRDTVLGLAEESEPVPALARRQAE